MLGRLEMSVEECIQAYQYISHEVFRLSRWRKIFGPLIQLSGWPLYDGQRLQDAVKAIIEQCGEVPDSIFETTDDRPCKVCVQAPMSSP